MNPQKTEITLKIIDTLKRAENAAILLARAYSEIPGCVCTAPESLANLEASIIAAASLLEKLKA